MGVRRLMILWLFLAVIVSAQETQPPVQPIENTAQKPASATVERSLSSLKTVIGPLSDAVQEVEKLRGDWARASSEEEKQSIQTQIDAAMTRVASLRSNFRGILGGAEAAEYEGSKVADTNLQEQVTELLDPLLGELREATSKPREMDELRKSLKMWQERKKKSSDIVDRIDQILAINQDQDLIPEVTSARQLWADRMAEAAGQIEVIQVQIEDRESHQEPIWTTVSRLFSNFFKSRGMNLLLALLVAAVGFFGTRRIYRLIRRYSPGLRSGKGSLFSRISDIVAMVLAVLIAVIGVLLVFYSRGDWLLLTLTVVALFGIAWAGKTALPPYLEQVRLLLNLGPVREGERLIYQGLPWKVAALGFYSRLVNPNLQGGTLRVPIRELMGMISRKQDPKEPWFPSEVDDWVVLSNDIFGKIISQSPEYIVILRLGGSLTTLPTNEYLESNPQNLSHGFRVSCTFGVDYQHQAEATTTIPKILLRALTTTLIGEFSREKVRSIKVEFENAAASSLDYRILVDFDGEMAQRYNALPRRIQHICVDTANAENWVIPFAQITVHQAAVAADLEKTATLEGEPE
ncbi:mechanosensitive ion channel [Luteolibacter pohnpeiensis]|nr:mechanosensitive ion channel [Luteolibacter pohnpeiensis]